MEHLRFKSNQTPAAYVSGALDPKVQEAFELHMMSCTECLEEVEAWRTIKDHMPEDAGTAPAVPRPGGAVAPARARTASLRFNLAASLAAVTVAGAAAGWYARSVQAPSLDAESMGFYSLPVRTRGLADCMSVRLDAPVKLIAVRIPGAAHDQQLVAVDSDGRDLNPESYSVRTQSDGSWLVRLRAATLRVQGIRFEARSADGTADPRGCLTNAAKD